jgi:hypothetical protein
VEHRIREIGVLLSLGYRFRQVRGRFLKEGALLTLLGTSLGLAGALLYARLLIWGLQTLWVDAVGASFLTLHVNQSSLATGFLISLLVVLGSISLTFRALTHIPATTMLGGKMTPELSERPGWSLVLLPVTIVLALVFLLTALATGSEASPILFFATGSATLAAGLSAFSLWLEKGGLSPIRPGGRLMLLRTALRNGARNRGRSLLSTILVACACFVIVAVGAHRSSPDRDIGKKDSGAGGFALRARTDVPLVRDLNDEEALYDLGFAEGDIDRLKTARFFPYRLLPGEDISCRNLYQPGRPRLLGVPDSQLSRGGFRFQSLIRESPNPWALLQEDLGPNVIPAFGDANSVTWILHKALGEDVSLRNERGQEIRLRLVGLLARSVFQSEILISERDFQRHFPSQTGYSYFLIEAPLERSEGLSTILETTLNRYGLDAVPTSQVLARFLAVENTYLSTFQTLGGLGLLLGTVGLAVVLMRNTLERRAELATLEACGFPRVRISWMVLAENCYLLVLGVVLGAVSALVAVSPHLMHSLDEVPWTSLGLTLLAVILAGMTVSFLSVRPALKGPLLETLRSE